MPDSLSIYVENLKREYATGVATEHSYRPALKDLLASLVDGLSVVNEPKRSDYGAPDYVIEHNGVPLGIVEAKDIDKHLDYLDRGSKDQLERYRKGAPNLIHTNYLHFRWYYDGNFRAEVSIGELRDGKITIHRDRFDELEMLLREFLTQQAPTISSAQELAQRMANMARNIAMLINRSLPDSPDLQAQMEAFEQTLMPGLTREQFADMYAQTLAYGLFAARVRYGEQNPEGFTLQNAFWNMPETNPFLKRFFQEIAPELDERVRWQAEILASLLAHANMGDILRDFGRKTRQEDPVVHFYETFLAVYNPAERERRGVYYTPEPVVSYIVRSVDWLLRERFGRWDGLADANTLILDPATGTGTFLYFVIDQIHETLRGQPGLWNTYVSESLLPRIFGFELLMAPYAVAHMKLGIQLQELNYEFQSGQRLEIYLTNTLEEAVKQGQQQFAQFINREANEAARIKREKLIMVVLGNPPYSGHSANKGKWITDLVRDYYKVDGKSLGERNPKWLQDDYVKFIRFGQWRIGETGSGVLAFVSNNGYIDNPTFRGMRQQLMQAFDDIYILNLHGNSRKRETTPDGGADENVFDIQQGVAIGIFVKHASPSPRVERGLGGEVHYADLYGLRENKYAALLNYDLANTDWQELTPQAPYYLFTPYNLDLAGEYGAGWKINEAMPVNTIGIVTGQDAKTIGSTISETQALAQAQGLGEDTVKPLLLHPFDRRFIVYDSKVITRPRLDVMRHVLKNESICISFPRSTTAARGFEHIFCSDSGMIARMYPDFSCITYFAPLYLYPDPNDRKLFADEGAWPPGRDGRVPNLNPAFVQEMEARLGLRFVPESDLTPWPPLHRMERGSQPPTPASPPSPLVERGLGGEVLDTSGLGGEVLDTSGLGGEVVIRDTSPELWEMLKPLARQMRREPTQAENHLWQHLRNRQVAGAKFRRQHAIGRFIVDFYCSEAGLIVEVDGPIHDYTPEEDAVRQEFLETVGFRVLRFTNDQVLNATKDVLETIAAALIPPSPGAADRSQPTRVSSPSPHVERGLGGEVLDTRGLGGEVLEANTFTPEDVFHYAYAIFHSPTYRERYAEFLKIDFPRLPLTGDVALFRALVEKGRELVDLHLVRHPRQQSITGLMTQYAGTGDDTVAPGYPRYEPAPAVSPSPRVERGPGGEVNIAGRVYINKTKYFAGIEPDDWDFHIGGYQVLEKWLKDRRGRALSGDDILHYQRVVVALRETRRLMDKIDDLIPAWPLA